MSAIARCLQSASHQFQAAAAPAILTQRSKSLVMASALVVLAGVSIAPSVKAQYVWGNGGQNSNRSEPTLSENTAARWGQILGGAVARAGSGAIIGSSATTAVGRTMQNAVTGISEEVGRNIGRNVAQEPFRHANRPPAAEVDYIDTAGLNAIFATDRATAAAVRGNRSSAEYRAAMAERDQTVRAFDLAVRSTAERGFNTSQWSELRAMLLRPLGSTPEVQFAAQGRVMADRLNREGGPGYRVPGTYVATTLINRRANLQGAHGQNFEYQDRP